jgi:hypothetical protein
VPGPSAPAAPLVADQGWPRVLSSASDAAKASPERRVPAVADGRGSPPLPGAPSSVNAAMKPALPDRKSIGQGDPDVTNSIAKKPPRTAVAARKRPAAKPTEWTLLGGLFSPRQ